MTNRSEARSVGFESTLQIADGSSKEQNALMQARKLGVISRVLSPVYGAAFTFASVERGAESAAGQLTLDEIRGIYRSMRLE